MVNLTRSAYAGQQRYGTITWSGDIAATWETLRRQIADGLNFCATGMPYWTLDIGAFFVQAQARSLVLAGRLRCGRRGPGATGSCTCAGSSMAAFLPMFRAHGTDTPREIWRFGEPGEPMYDALVKFLQLRYRLLPYIYSLAGWVTQDDYTMLRAPGLRLPRLIRPCTTSRDQFMFGPAFLVNPVTQPMYYAVDPRPLTGVDQRRTVYLPAGCDWYDFWTDRRLTGGQTVQADASLDILPLYVRAGSIVPMGQPMQYVDELPDAPLELHIYPGCDGSFLLYEDEGDSYNYEQGAFSTIHMRWQDATRRLLLEHAPDATPACRSSARSRWCCTAKGMPERRQFVYAGEPIMIGF